MGGMFGESKFDILKKLPSKYVPTTIRILWPAKPGEVTAAIRDAGMNFPVIFKPDIGERGLMVERINHEQDIEPYLRKLRCSLIVQELVTCPLEFGVFYLRFPTETKGRVISVVAKEMLSVIGDGRSTLAQLVLENDRAKLQWEKLKIRYHDRLDSVLPFGEKLELVSIGNHCLGTKFINANHLIDDRLSASFDEISCRVQGFYFGRYDLRCQSVEDLYAGNVKVMELNGCGAEPAHIYDSQYSLWSAFYDLVRHWDLIFRIARANNELGVEYISHREAYAYYRKFKSVVG